MSKSEWERMTLGISYSGEFTKAVERGDVARCEEILELPVEKGGLQIFRYPQTDMNGNTVLHIAARKGDLKMIQYLTNGNLLGSNSPNNVGKTPADLAREKGHMEIAELLSSATNSNT